MARDLVPWSWWHSEQSQCNWRTIEQQYFNRPGWLKFYLRICLGPCPKLSIKIFCSFLRSDLRCSKTKLGMRYLFAQWLLAFFKSTACSPGALQNFIGWCAPWNMDRNFIYQGSDISFFQTTWLSSEWSRDNWFYSFFLKLNLCTFILHCTSSEMHPHIVFYMRCCHDLNCLRWDFTPLLFFAG